MSFLVGGSPALEIVIAPTGSAVPKIYLLLGGDSSLLGLPFSMARAGKKAPPPTARRVGLPFPGGEVSAGLAQDYGFLDLFDPAFVDETEETKWQVCWLPPAHLPLHVYPHGFPSSLTEAQLESATNLLFLAESLVEMTAGNAVGGRQYEDGRSSRRATVAQVFPGQRSSDGMIGLTMEEAVERAARTGCLTLKERHRSGVYNGEPQPYNSWTTKLDVGGNGGGLVGDGGRGDAIVLVRGWFRENM